MTPWRFALLSFLLFRGRVLSTEFMDLPNRKQWSIYYKTIKRPQCLENVFVRIPVTLCYGYNRMPMNSVETSQA